MLIAKKVQILLILPFILLRRVKATLSENKVNKFLKLKNVTI